jgi:hypothetical protein
MLYVSIKQSGGWTIYSSDTRVPAIVGQSDNGSFEELMLIDGARLWIQSLAEDMELIRSLPDEELNFSEEEIANNKAFWESVSSPSQYIKEKLLPETRSSDDFLLAPGHYELASSISYTEVYDSIPSLITTKWHQNNPYNIYCPLKSDNSTNAPAGCVAIAGAQMLYFLHNHLGVPLTAPSEAYCDGNINSYTWSQTNYTTDIWDKMGNGIYAAPLIADIGRRVSMKYGDNSSSASLKDLVKKVFSPYSISCTYANYDSDLLKKSLNNEMPVILGAMALSTSDKGTEKVGHAFIADRYKRSQTVTKNTYNWVYDTTPPYKPLPMVPEKIEYTYSSPTINMIGMNWGWDSYYIVSDEWYTLTGDWIITRDYYQRNWNIDRRMIYDFKVKDD